MKQEQKLIAGVAVLVALGVGVYVTGQKAAQDAATHSAAGPSDLPQIKVAKDAADKVTKIVIANKDKGEVTLEKKDKTWSLSKPLAASANQKNVEDLIKNLDKLVVKSQIAKDAKSYPKYELEDAKAVHVTVFKGEEKALDAYFGKRGGRGQMMRIGGQDGVYLVDGYSSYLYGRDMKNWRDTDVLKFEDANAVSVEIENEHAKYSFSKNGEDWAASLYPRGKTGKIAARAKKWPKFEAAKVKDMLRAYKNLRATDFATKGADTGTGDAPKTGGVVRIKLKDDAGDYTLRVGKAQEGSNRYLAKDGADTIYVISSWASDWATAEPAKFEKTEKKEGGKTAGPAGLPPGLAGLPPGLAGKIPPRPAGKK